MAKTVKTARGESLDWDLLRIQTTEQKNVAEVVEVVDHAAVAARRLSRQKMEAAKKLLAAAESKEVHTPAITAKGKRTQENA